MPARNPVLISAADGDTGAVAGQPLIGRDAELAAVVRALDDARRRAGRLVLVTGAPGIGKTRLAEAAVEQAHVRRLRVARGYAVADPGAPPLWPWQRVLRGRLPDLAAVPDVDAAARFQQLVALTDLLAAAAEPDGLLLVLEDLHWADAASIRLLRHVANELPTLPIAVVATCRSAASALWRDAVPDLVRTGAEVIELSGLRPADLARWQAPLADDPRRAEAVWAATGGNPLLVRLIAADLAAPLDELMAARPQLRRLVAARVLALPPDARAVVEAASVLGERLVPSVLATMTGRTDVHDQVELARQAGVLGERAFEHALVRDAVYGELDDTRRRGLHRAAAEALEVSAPGLPGVIAGHWHRADDPHRCLPWAVRADDAARAALAHDDAAGFAAMAVDCAERLDDHLAEMLIRRAEVELLQGYAEAGARTCARAAVAAAGCADLVADAALVVHGSGLPAVHRLIRPLCEQALEGISPGDHARRARLLAQRAIIAAEEGQADQARTLAAQAMGEADRCEDADARYEAIAARHFTIMVPDTVGERAELGARAIALAGRTSRPTASLWGHIWRLDAAFQLGAMDEVERELAEIDRTATDGRWLTARWHHLRHAAMLACLRGEFDTARIANEGARAIGERLDDVSMTGLSFAFTAQLAIIRGDPGELPEQWADEVFAAPPMPLVRVSLPMLHALTGRTEQAKAEFAAFRTLPDTLPRGVRWAATLTQIGMCAVQLEDRDVAAAVLRQLHDLADSYQGDGSGGVFTVGACALQLGDLSRVAGDPERAIELYRTAIALDARIGARPFEALSRLGLAEALHASGAAAGDVQVPAAAASAEFARLDMPGPLRRARALLAPAPQPSPLTARESEIAGLVARALSNRDIAAELVLSERTVETHVRSILAKLGFGSRTEIVAWVLGQPSGPGRGR